MLSAVILGTLTLPASLSPVLCCCQYCDLSNHLYLYSNFYKTV